MNLPLLCLVLIVLLAFEVQAQGLDEGAGPSFVRDQCPVAEDHFELQRTSNNACALANAVERTLSPSAGQETEPELSPNSLATRSPLNPRWVDVGCEIIPLKGFESCRPEICAAYPKVFCRKYERDCRGTGLLKVPACHGCSCQLSISEKQRPRIDDSCEIANKKNVETCKPRECARDPWITCRRFGLYHQLF